MQKREKIMLIMAVVVVAYYVFTMIGGDDTTQQSQQPGAARDSREQQQVVSGGAQRTAAVQPGQEPITLEAQFALEWKDDPFYRTVIDTTGSVVSGGTIDKLKCTMAVSGNGRQFAWINGSVYRIGDIIEGYELIEISKNNIKVRSTNSRLIYTVNVSR
ncbi:hypothetical protein ACFL67_03665 [candidate division KSB1 bacterium]